MDLSAKLGFSQDQIRNQVATNMPWIITPDPSVLDQGVTGPVSFAETFGLLSTQDNAVDGSRLLTFLANPNATKDQQKAVWRALNNRAHATDTRNEWCMELRQNQSIKIYADALSCPARFL